MDDDWGGAKTLCRQQPPPNHYPVIIWRWLFGRRYFVEMIGPKLQCSAHFTLITRAIINSSHTSLVTTHMIKHSFDYVRLHTKLSHSSCSGPAKIMQAPRCNPQSTV